ncbi:MAG: helix-turn-helix domain-containing protein [Caloramator sp.]|nr:helix-turn-helix domain-containing protein [Caloramator sp.]
MFSQRLKELRKEKKLTQTELAKEIGLSKSAIVQYESNKRIPNYEILSKLADFFGVTTDYMIGRTDYKTNIKKLEETLLAYRKVLEKLEWHSFAGEIGFLSNCPMCGAAYIHDEDCELGKLLREGDE